MDCPSNEEWSNNLDNLVSKVVNGGEVTLYGGRDSFIPYYTGTYLTKELKQTLYVSGTKVRKSLSKHIKGSSDFRHGVIWSTQNRWPQAIPTVDIAILNEDKTQILLGRRESEEKYRFPGGFVEPGFTYEDAARKEMQEETGLFASSFDYVGSYVIGDWRYRSERDKITTTLFVTTGYSGIPKPGDDIDYLQWFNFPGVSIHDVVNEHANLLDALKRKVLGNYYDL